MSAYKRWRGLRTLVTDAVHHGSIAIEKIQLETAKKPFRVLADMPDVGQVAKGVHQIHDVSVSSVHTVIRLVNQVVGSALDVAITVAERVKPDVVEEPATTTQQDAT